MPICKALTEFTTKLLMLASICCISNVSINVTNVINVTKSIKN